ncbi:BQ5605_C003g01888 [Microbotryum silenes-dioicae]|uniref:BQ5605_C003g01888 protein n=1 Tax=Microbotryum silenes-dioicae TaxID=796604 RepID=A0A2X0M012_9BASI|nr:BQ5605_C003g01888 [Microbotryum silenes-dioicae]
MSIASLQPGAFMIGRQCHDLFHRTPCPQFLGGLEILASYFEGVARKYLSIAFESRGLPMWAKSCCSLSAAVAVIDTTVLDFIGLERGKASTRPDMPDIALVESCRG